MRMKWKIIVLCALIFLHACSSHEPVSRSKLLIYYGTPMGVNDVWDEDEAADILSYYDYLVLAKGLEEPSDSHHRSTKAIIERIHKRNKNALIFGYVNLDMTETKLTYPSLLLKFRQWQAMGVDGIFLDCAGFDYEVSRKRFNTAVKLVHEMGMPAFVNAWDPDDVMGNKYHPLYNPDQQATAMRAGDYYLLEKFLLPYDPTDEESPSLFSDVFVEKIEKALYYRDTLGVKMLSVSRIDYSEVSEEALLKFFHMNEAAAGVFSLDGYGVSSVEYGSSPIDNDLVYPFPFMKNYLRYYTDNPSYRAHKENQQFARKGFMVHSSPSEHYYELP